MPSSKELKTLYLKLSLPRSVYSISERWSMPLFSSPWKPVSVSQSSPTVKRLRVLCV